jgi:hypothetical protein
MSEQRDEFFYGKTCLADDCPQRSAMSLLVIADGGLFGWGFANHHDVTVQ